MLESRYIQQVCCESPGCVMRTVKDRGRYNEAGRDEALVFLQSPGAVWQCLSEVLHQHQSLMKLHS